MQKIKPFLLFLFVIPILLIPFITEAAGTIQLPKTGQTKCYDTAGKEIACAGTGQDGEIQTGVAWPSPRFLDNGDGIITDKLTGLMWPKDANLIKTRNPDFDNDDTSGDGKVTWQHALDYMAKLNNENYLGHNDWRLSNANELESFINADEPNTSTWLNTKGFSNVQSNNYWSSSTNVANTGSAWIVSMWDGYVDGFNKESDVNYVWPVRSGQSGSFGNLVISQTGQTKCYDTSDTEIACTGTGQDGEIQAGVAWPNPRFSDNNNDTVTDNLTGLMWTKDANAPGPSACSLGASMAWQEALDYVKCLNSNNYLGYNDWHLPNRKELRSLSDYSNYDPGLPLDYPFTNVQSSEYWSSSTVANNTNYAWFVLMWDGYVDSNQKDNFNNYVWPVRSGQSGSSKGCGEKPKISKLSKMKGKIEDKITITGSGFCNDKGKVLISRNSVEVSCSVVTWKDKEISITVPWGVDPGKGKIFVETTDAIRSGKDFTYIKPKLEVKSLSPKIVKTGDEITIKGGDFGPAQSKDEKVIAKGGSVSVVSWSNNSITVTLDSATGRKLELSVQTFYGKSNVKAVKVKS